MYLESTAILPQLYMFQKQASDEGGVVEVGQHRMHTHMLRMECKL